MSVPRPEALRAWRAFLEAHARVTRILEAELEAEQSLPLAWYDVLVQLQEREGTRVRMGELAGAVLLSRAGLSRLVDRMVAAGLVQREPCEDDRRGTYVVATGAGRARLKTAAPTHLRGIEAYFGAKVSDDEAALLESVLRRIAP